MKPLSLDEEIQLKEIGSKLRDGSFVTNADALFMLKMVKKLTIKYESSVKAFRNYVLENSNG